MPPQFEAVLRNAKSFEVRSCIDRTFKLNQVVRLCEYDPDGVKGFTSRFVDVRICSMVPSGTFGLPTHICVFGFTDIVWGPTCSMDDQVWQLALGQGVAVAP